jgi:hypothetical protein
LASGTKLAAKVESGGLTLSVPATAPDAISSTIVLRVKGSLNIE